MYRLACNINLSRSGLVDAGQQPDQVDAGQQPDQGGFACAIVAEQGVDFTFIDFQINPIEGGKRTEPFDQFFGADDGDGCITHFHSPPVMRLRTLSFKNTATSSTIPTKTR